VVFSIFHKRSKVFLINIIDIVIFLKDRQRAVKKDQINYKEEKHTTNIIMESQQKKRRANEKQKKKKQYPKIDDKEVTAIISSIVQQER
jgi:hypothetical protein